MPASAEMVGEDATTPTVPVSTPVTAELRQRGRGGNIKTKVRKRPVYDDDLDVHRVSSGSDTD
ncbi:hypothetical protein BYT27DRAFT_7190901 [Phlegmacium glaucopus]|nr:hypothetical protein BYT27DRAFT_7190901 [Phlegmacium glaucopus]